MNDCNHVVTAICRIRVGLNLDTLIAEPRNGRISRVDTLLRIVRAFSAGLC